MIEEFLDGPEVSVFALADGDRRRSRCCPPRTSSGRGDGDTGPNTGGMGAVRAAALGAAGPGRRDPGHRRRSPPWPSCAAAALPTAGLLYAGLSLTSRGLRVIEFNARFGDPETQVVLDRLATPLGGLLGRRPTATWRRSGAHLSGYTAPAPAPRLASGRRRHGRGRGAGYPARPPAELRSRACAEAAAVPGAYVLHAGHRLAATAAGVQRRPGPRRGRDRRRTCRRPGPPPTPPPTGSSWRRLVPHRHRRPRGRPAVSQ